MGNIYFTGLNGSVFKITSNTAIPAEFNLLEMCPHPRTDHTQLLSKSLTWVW